MGDVMKTLYLERALFVVGHQNDGKSTQLRSMFKDWGLGARGKIPVEKSIVKRHWLGQHRGLLVRLTSPHEYRETPEEFHAKIRADMKQGRWCLAAPLQPEASNSMPDVVETIRLFQEEFCPERIRVCFLLPCKRSKAGDKQMDISTTTGHIRRLWKRSSESSIVECVIIDAASPDGEGNGHFLADYFEYR
ncbi:hypothetical protein CNO08_07825 [Lysobacter capsici]|nr:hypothetical protein CNO08_07825 [Lysobacter capsici]